MWQTNAATVRSKSANHHSGKTTPSTARVEMIFRTVSRSPTADADAAFSLAVRVSLMIRLRFK
ncbi:MAG: hypothetical protein LBR80_06235 [Deltaproteobacteria bacterium]|nr:hypothetical protein [Deltaproteobacteria bacterium]